MQEQTRRPDEVVLCRTGPCRMRSGSDRRAGRGVAGARRHLVLPVNVGLAEALTAGLDACAHDVVARMDADDVAVPERFAPSSP